MGDSLFAGLKLIGISIWERRAADGRNVTFPARHYSVNGERRSFALRRPGHHGATAVCVQACAFRIDVIEIAHEARRQRALLEGFRRNGGTTCVAS